MTIQNYSQNFKVLLLLFLLVAYSSCKEKIENQEIIQTEKDSISTVDPFFKLSLAQWSLHKSYAAKDGLNPMHFAKQAKELGFEGVEYVDQLFNAEIEKLGIQQVLDSLLSESKTHNITNVLIMVDTAGDLADPSEEIRNRSVENHKKWVDAGQYLGCHSIRVNTFGSNDPKVWHDAAVDGLTKLSDYAASKNINVIVENHGWLSSDAEKLMAVINAVNKPNCGTLPDSGNFCIKRKDGAKWGECEEHFDIYKGIELMMPKAKGFSAKSEDYHDAGVPIDYNRMMKIVKDSGFDGFVGIEYESDKFEEEEGIIHLKNLVLEAAKNITN